MIFVSYQATYDPERVGLLIDGHIVDLEQSAGQIGFTLPSKVADFLAGEERFMQLAKEVEVAYRGENKGQLDPTALRLLAPVPRPTSCRDGYAFRQHVATARRNRGVEMIPEFDQFPVFYFTNHNSIVGPGEVLVEDDHLQQLDFELECAIVIGKRGKNISVAEADRYIAGFMVMNDFSARVLQMDEMKLSLGPAKGKDFATAIGPWLVTPDELKGKLKQTDFGNTYDLKMRAWHNGKQISEGNLKDMNWTFAEIIERASYGVELLPGDVIGSGTVGTGCYLELNGTHALQAKEKGDKFTPIWLQNGDSIELEIDGLGRLSNTIVKVPYDYSILEKKKQAEHSR